jgi:excisionase family DNA binding protein
MTNQLLTLDQVADRLSVSRSTVSRLLKQSHLRSARIGGNRRVLESDLEAFIKSAMNNSEDVPEGDVSEERP